MSQDTPHRKGRKWAATSAADSIKAARSHRTKDIKKILVDLVKEQDARVSITGGGHMEILHPDGEGIVRMSASPEDKYVLKKVLRDLRVHGHFDV